jgi:predicted Zn-dependent protease
MTNIWWPICLALVLNSCAAFRIEVPTVANPALEQYVRAVGLEIAAVSEHRDRSAAFRFKLADFARPDILGLSMGKQRIFISYELTRLAYRSNKYRWLLRHTLAHEIAHDVLGRGSTGSDDMASSKAGLANRVTSRDLGLPPQVAFRPYSRAAELDADRKAMEYWQKLGWDCQHWVRLFLDFIAQGYRGDVDHPTRERLTQAVQICAQQQLAAPAE